MRIHHIPNFETHTKEQLINIAWENSEYIINNFFDKHEINNARILRLNPILKHLLQKEIITLKNKYPKSFGIKESREGGLNIVTVLRHAFETVDNPYSITWKLKREGDNKATFLAGNEREIILQHYYGKDSKTMVIDAPEYDLLTDYVKGEMTYGDLEKKIKEFNRP